MAGRIAAFDWSGTPIGPIEAWPQSLRTTVSIMLNTQYAMFLFWGPAATSLYNDAYRPSLGHDMHPKTLGKPGAECWSDIWHIIGPQIDAVMQRGEHTWFEDQLVPFDRNGYFEEIYFTYSYSPVYDESGTVGGCLVVCSETTERVLAERRLLTLQVLSVVTEDDPATVIPGLIGATRTNESDIAFALLYRLQPANGVARLVDATGLTVGHPAAPAECGLAGESGWSTGLSAVVKTRQPHEIDDLAAAGLSSFACGRWPEPVQQARVLPIAAGDDPVAFLLILGISPRKQLDEAYRNFTGLVAAQYAAAIARGLRREQERERIRQLAELDQTKTAFLAGVSHELRTPLTLILGPMEALLRDPRLQPDVLGQLNTAHRNAIRLRKLVDSLLDFSRLQAGRMTFEPEPTDLAELTAVSVSAFHSMAAAAGLELTYQRSGPAIANVDRGLWDKIVLNLVSNAIKYTSAGSVTVRVGSADGRVQLSVSDTGIGIAEADLPLIFERFRRVDDASGRSVEGVGIGLALVADFVRLHGGDLTVDSEPGRGTTFAVNLPASTADSVRPLAMDGAVADPFVAEVRGWIDTDRALAAGSASGPSDAEIGTPAARVLVVDDNADMREYLARTLRGISTVELAVDGLDALARVASVWPDLIISDVMMPRLDGISMLRKLRADERFAELPVIMLSARAGEGEIIEGIDAGATDYLPKPFSAGELSSRVRAILDSARMRRERARDAARHLRQISTVADISTLLNAAQSIEDVRTVVAGPVATSLGALACELHLGELAEPVELDGSVRTVIALGHQAPAAAGWLVVRWDQPPTLAATDLSMLQAVANAVEQAAYRAGAFDRERRLATTVQQALLPQRTPLIAGLDIAWNYRAATTDTLVGGDWFDVLELPDDQVAFVIGDVVGHGLTAAAVMSELRHALQVFLYESPAPAAALRRLNQLACSRQPTYATVACLVLDQRTRLLQWCLAGHPPAMLRRAGSVRQLRGGLGTPIGVNGIGYLPASRQLEPGDLVLLYTDGLIERRDRGLQLDQLATWLAGARPASAAQLVEQVADAMLPPIREDDAAVLAFVLDQAGER